MNLKGKFEQYQTDFDKKAWQDFDQLRKQYSSSNKTKKNMNGNNVLYFISALLLASLVSVSGIIYFNHYQNSDKNDVINMPTKQISKESSLPLNLEKIAEVDNQLQNNEAQHNPSTTLLTKETLTKQTSEVIEKPVAFSENKLTQNSSNSILKNKKTSYQKNYSVNTNDLIQNEAPFIAKKTDQTANPVQSVLNNLNLIAGEDKSEKLFKNKTENSENENTSYPKNDVWLANKNTLTRFDEPQIDLDNHLLKNSLFNNNSTKNKRFEPKNKEAIAKENFSSTIHQLPIIESLLQGNTQLITKPQQFIEAPDIVYDNTFKLNINYIPDYGIYNFMPDANPTKATGFFVELDYRRRLSRMLSVGIGLGYAHGKDRNNPQLDTTDKATDAHAHLRVHLFFINNPNNRLLFKGGTGLSYTGQSFRYKIDEMTSGIRENNFYYMGFTLEAAYERNITQQLFIGLQIGWASGNDGFAYPGASIGYNF